ncbi:MAG: flagellar export chaperone FliS [Phycisphaerales bacterium]|nr:MAG: flagellar export chaperone FliS [Phycisphaerales bacterium]
MTNDPTNAYLRSKVFSASPEELRLMLLDGAIRFTRQGREGLANNNPEQTYNGLSSAKNILLELVSSLRPEVDPDLCSKLSALYMFMYRRLVDANLEKNTGAADEVIGLLEYERETWVLLMEKVRRERDAGVDQVSGAVVGALPQGAAPTRIERPQNGDTNPSRRTSISIEG